VYVDTWAWSRKSTVGAYNYSIQGMSPQNPLVSMWNLSLSFSPSRAPGSSPLPCYGCAATTVRLHLGLTGLSSHVHLNLSAIPFQWKNRIFSHNKSASAYAYHLTDALRTTAAITCARRSVAGATEECSPLQRHCARCITRRGDAVAQHEMRNWTEFLVLCS
jgi:hypothetical protein